MSQCFCLKCGKRIVSSTDEVTGNLVVDDCMCQQNFLTKKEKQHDNEGRNNSEAEA
jgi:hypothetical protein